MGGGGFFGLHFPDISSLAQLVTGISSFRTAAIATPEHTHKACGQPRSGAKRANISKEERSRPISRVLSWTTIHLGPPSPAASSDLPGSLLADKGARQRRTRSPIWSCSGWGLPCHRRYRRRGALLPHHFTLTNPPEAEFGGIFSVALSVGSRPPGVTWHPALWSPDFPPVRSL